MSSDRAGRPVAVTIAATMVRAIIMVFSATPFLCMVSPQNHAQVKGHFSPFVCGDLSEKLIYISHMDCEVNTFRNYFAKNANFEPFSGYFVVFASSYSAIPAATDTLNDSFCPNIGISIISSAKASHSGAIPSTSSPSSSATRSGAE